MKTILTITFALLLGFGFLSYQCPAQTTAKIKIYLVALDDNGKSGRKIGCGDSLVAVTRETGQPGAPLKAALEALIASGEETSEKGAALKNFWQGTNLKVDSVSIKKGTAVIKISGTLPVAGICDEPRITEQITATAKQFKTVKKVSVTINGVALKEAIR